MLRPKKSLGQVFLSDTNLLAKIARLAEAQGKVVVEIGAGDGRLTELLAKQAAMVYPVEVDRELFAFLKARFADAANVVPLHRDATKLQLAKISASDGQRTKIKVVGNLPYNSFVQIILTLMGQLDQIEDIRVMAQEEMANRLTAAPRTHQYGRLSVSAQARTRVRRLVRAPRTAFWPRPKVDSVFVALSPREGPFSSEEVEVLFDRFVSAAFGHRRKTLINSLGQSSYFAPKISLIGELLAQSGIPTTCRAEDIEVDKYIALVARLAEVQPGEGLSEGVLRDE